MNIGLTRALGEFVTELRPTDIPREVHDIVTVGFTDLVACMIAGRADDTVRVTAEVYLPAAVAGHSHIAFNGRRSDAPTAAMLNGIAAHVLDFDDVSMRGHPSAAIVPAIIAEAEDLDATGEAMLTAYVAGYETWAELNRREPDSLHSRGWHPTAVYGILAATAACANLRGLNATQATNAIALAASQASGLTANFGSSSKSLHVGRANMSGILCARLAAAGATGAHDALENPRGFLAAFSPKGHCDLSEVRAPMNARLRILEHGLSVKRYPVCYAAHRIIDAMIELRVRVGFIMSDIATIIAKIGATQAGMLRISEPHNALEAKFSAEFCLSAAAFAGHVGFAQLSDQFLARADVRDMMRRVEIVVDAQVDANFPNYCPFDVVTVVLRDGSKHESRPVARAKGHSTRPLLPAELRDKFDDCIAGALEPEMRDRLFANLQNLASARARHIFSVTDAQPAPSEKLARKAHVATN